ncbi:adenylyltransferase/cytidyltransferase family protein [Bacillus atrophaeus]|uniref:adenylyltransferase/cytidyltransferase family protein n=1 Tax=Bacillus atrophaeus TaxID=1452 RepID=UPI00227E7087|nr:adenylyltransferase/cytidyltransferase family protein [Bacillus atrophaeus]
MKKVITYGTFDLLHWGHIKLLERAKQLGDYLVVAISNDEFNLQKQKKAYHSYEHRKMILETIEYVLHFTILSKKTVTMCFLLAHSICMTKNSPALTILPQEKEIYHNCTKQGTNYSRPVLL